MKIKEFTINNFNVAEFLSDYWQKKPLLIRGAFPNFQNRVSADELAGLSCEEEIESRVIKAIDNNWELQHGPFSDDYYHKLPDSDWTLLVQAVDQWVAEVAELLNYFQFIPNWRIDDIMVSYAVKGGSVGPHYDNYDVFLLQGSGRRNWKIGPKFHKGVNLKDNDNLRLIEDFQCCDDWILEPGDMLYLPPLFSHWGISLSDDCMTYSMGFRAPAYAEILSDFCDHQISLLDTDLRYSDANLKQQPNPGEITVDVIESIKSILMSQLSDTESISEWFGRYMTEQKYQQSNQQPEALQQQQSITFTDFFKNMDEDELVYRDPSSRISFFGTSALVTAFVNGDSYSNISRKCIEILSEKRCYTRKEIYNLALSDMDKSFIVKLFDHGILYIDDEILD